MNYRCLTCGFVQDFKPEAETVCIYHPWMAGRLVNDCPACTKFILNGGRKRGNKDPNITEVGKLVEEQTVLDQLHALERAFSMLSQGDASEAAEWDGKKVFGWTPSELLEMSSKKV